MTFRLYLVKPVKLTALFIYGNLIVLHIFKSLIESPLQLIEVDDPQTSTDTACNVAIYSFLTLLLNYPSDFNIVFIKINENSSLC